MASLLASPIAPLTPATDELLRPGARIGRFEIVRWIGSGGSADVYEVEHLELGRRLALKLVRHDDVSSAATLARFRREVRAVGALRHEGIADVLDTGLTDLGEPYLVMELLEGESLDVRIARAPLAVEAAVELVRQLLIALARVHDKGLTHGDVKPQNVFLHRGADGRLRVKLIDFGLSSGAAREPRGDDEPTVGTPEYMAPDVVMGAAYAPAHDVYGAALVLFESLTGRTPYEAESPARVISAVVEQPLVSVRALRPDCPAALASVVERALAKRPEDRYHTPRELSVALTSALPAPEQVSPDVSGVRPASLAARTASGVEPGPAWRWALTPALLLLLASLLVALAVR